jgi:hypothetical protein
LVWGYADREGAPWYLDLAVIVLGIAVPLLFLVGLAGLYVKFRRQTRWLSWMGFVISFAAAGWLTVAGIRSAPALYRHLGERNLGNLSKGGAQECGLCLLQKASLLLSSPLTWLFVGLGIVGLIAIREGPLRHWGFLLLALTLFGWVYLLTDDDVGIVDVRSLHVIFGILFALSWMLVGYALCSSKN